MLKRIYEGLDAKKHQGLIKIFSNWIYLAGWIANLGVVPLLLFAAFLLFPALVFLRALLFFVTLVFETISILLHRIQLCDLRRIKYLPRMVTSVKALGLSLLLVPQLAMSVSSKPLKNQTLILAIGEVRELSLPSLDRFTIGNNDYLSHKFFESKKSLLLKGKKLGLAQLHIWNKNGGKAVYQIYVLSKSNQLKLLSLTESLLSIGLEVENKGPWLLIRGELASISEYNQFLKIKKENEDKLQIKITFTKELEKNLLTEVIKSLFDDHISGFKCLIKSLELICHLRDDRTPSPQLEKYLVKKYGVRFIRHKSSNKNKNYRLKVKIIQVESSEAEAHGFGVTSTLGRPKGNLRSRLADSL